jgi:hypothetical protein
MTEIAALPVPVERPPPTDPVAGQGERAWRPRLRWFAAEYLIVVLGVLTAVSLNAWWQGRQDAAAERNYLALISRDLSHMIVNLQELGALEDRQVQSGLRVYRILSAPVPAEDQRDLASNQLSQLMTRRTMHTTDATFQDLLSTGGLRLLQNRELRDQLVGFYEEAERSYDVHNKNNAVFVDNLFAHELLGRGLIHARPGSLITSRSRPDSILHAELSPGYADEPHPMWQFPPSAPEWAIIRSLLIQRIRVSVYAREFAEVQLEETRIMKNAVDAELGR